MLFLSYAEEDGRIGAEIAEWLRSQGFDVYHWQDPRHRGGLFIEQIEDAIGRADAFLALLSPSFLASAWCRRERGLAIQREIDLGVRRPTPVFIHVLKIHDTPGSEAGFLRNYDWVDLASSQDREPTLRRLADRLRQSNPTALPSTVAPDPRSKSLDLLSSAFFGHRDELDKLVSGLANAEGPHFWLVTAPPGFGKSWFLQRISSEVTSLKRFAWVVRIVDLREQPSDVRRDAGALLGRLLGLGTAIPTGQEELRDIAEQINQSGRSCLCLLDSAELLDAETSVSVRLCLSEIYRHMQSISRSDVRLAVIVASRRDNEWRGVVPPPRISRLPLSEFKADVVWQALRDLARQMHRSVDPTTLKESTALVHRLSEGLPALVVRCLQWIRREEWLEIERLESKALFEELAEPYIQQRLLSQDGLGPWSRGGAGQPRYMLEQVFRVLAPYRLFTQSHLRHHIELDLAFARALDDLGWSIDDLWNAISASDLLARPLDEPWQEIHPAIRRLLFRYYYTSDERQADAHSDAGRFVEVWTAHQEGKDQVIGLVECLWHEAAVLRLTRSTAIEQVLSESTDKLFLTLRLSSAYTAMELRAFAAERIRSDEEFQNAVGDVTGLSADLTGIVVAPTFSGYVPRPEERQIRREAARVQEDGRSRAVLLYGPGGVGKTWLVRQLALANAADQTIIWLDPIDLDDSESWLLSNLEHRVARRLDPENRYFGPYQEYLSRLPTYTRPPMSRETVISHLGRVKRIFVECYTRFVEETGTTVVIVFDTVEAISGMYLLLTLTQWMKALPATLFVVSGRPLPGQGDGSDQTRQDPIRMQLEDPHQGLPVTTVRLGEFTQKAALDYLDASLVATSLSDHEKEKLIRLTRGHPLWLAFTISYLQEKGLPQEAEMPLADIERDVPYEGDMTAAGLVLHEAFKRRMMAPYRETDFWHEAMKRLAVIRQGLSQPIWQRLMADRPLPDNAASLDEAWEMLLQAPWIRPRASGRYVTLHDALAEELAQRVIPLHDQDKTWRRQLWSRAIDIYSEATERSEGDLAVKLAALDERLQILDISFPPKADDYPAEEGALIQEAARLDAEKRELYQLRSACLYYQILWDYAEGCRQFLDLFELAKEQQDILFEDLLALEIQRFLPGGIDPHAVGDVIGGEVYDFRRWLCSEGTALHLEVGLSLADYLLRNEQPETAINLLDELPATAADHRQNYRIDILRGNACMRIPGRVKDGREHFRRALDEAASLPSDDRYRLIAMAHKELGFYYRNEGLWQAADEAYRLARDVISAALSTPRSDGDREEMASIESNWAYVKGLVGRYREGQNLVESAITVRHRLNNSLAEGSSWSICGEVYRYERRFEKAWHAYSVAEQIFQAQRSWSWLGLIYQEQAICLFQAIEDGINLTPDPIEQAKRLITLALDICRDQAIRAYPSALNRAGRIFGQEDLDAGLRYLTEGIDWARRLSDGWFWFANLIEYVQLCYRAWEETGQHGYRDEIISREADVGQAMSEYEFPDLRGRWILIQGHLAIHDWLEIGDETRLGAALDNYKVGFALLAQGSVGSSGAAAVPGEFRKFQELFSRLAPEVHAHWREELRRAWSRDDIASTLLLARLEELD